MLRKSLIAVALVGFSGVAAAVELPAFPKDAENEQDARVQAYYKAQCQKDMALMMPVGMVPDQKEDES